MVVWRRVVFHAMVIAVLGRFIGYSVNPEEIRPRETEMTEKELADAEDGGNQGEAVGWWVGIPVSMVLVQTRR